jgi:hypothetical protein
MAAAAEGRAYLAMMMLKCLMKQNMQMQQQQCSPYLECGVIRDTEV